MIAPFSARDISGWVVWGMVGGVESLQSHNHLLLIGCAGIESLRHLRSNCTIYFWEKNIYTIHSNQLLGPELAVFQVLLQLDCPDQMQLRKCNMQWEVFLSISIIVCWRPCRLYSNYVNYNKWQVSQLQIVIGCHEMNNRSMWAELQNRVLNELITITWCWDQ
jgi:hypothetical protein